MTTARGESRAAQKTKVRCWGEGPANAGGQKGDQVLVDNYEMERALTQRA